MEYYGEAAGISPKQVGDVTRENLFTSSSNFQFQSPSKSLSKASLKDTFGVLVSNLK